MDRNTVIGFVLLGVLLFIYLFTSTKSSKELAARQKREQDSIAFVNSRKQAAAAKEQKAMDTATTAAVVDSNSFDRAFRSAERQVTVENDLVKIVFSNEGGQPVDVELKKFKSYDSTPVRLVRPGTDSRISYSINTGSNQSAQIADLYFDAAQVVKNADGSQTVRFKLPSPAGESLEHEFVLPADSYLLSWNVHVGNPDKLFTQNTMNLTWHAQLDKTQENVSIEKQYSSIGFFENNSFDYMSRGTEKDFEKPVQWLALSQQFFNRTIIAKNNFVAGGVRVVKETSDTSSVISKVDATLQTKIPAEASATVPLQLYFGPNDFDILDKQAPGMTHIIDLGRGMYSFVRPVNVYIIRPVFNFFKSHISSFGIAILLLTLFIRLVTSPLVYSSYLSGAKMKALRPEIETLRKKVGGDQQQMGVEQMKLFREAGVNPLGGCIPALLQIPIFFALYSFFSSNIGLRGEHFLWSKDLSTYDTIVHFGFSIPGYGDHVSLFALCAVVTSFLISLYGMSMTPDQSNPAMKYMPYFMPVILLLVFNKLASALTWYYTVSNVITLALQFVIQNYIIDHEKILAKLQDNRSKPKAKSKWQERLEQMQEQQKEIQKRTQGRKG
ncbi:membrane protein insertase YidC [Puia sp. P3]|uniref:membrane protein insertase YidC n=1 Tax=Puia sp. P3 TaxID=3423952 RepID=UPI003D676848